MTFSLGRSIQIATHSSAIVLAAALLGAAASAQDVTEIIDATGDGAGNGLTEARVIALDAAGNAYLTGLQSENAFKVDTSGVVSEIIDSTGDGLGNTLIGSVGIAVDSSGNVYVTGFTSDNVFRITPGGAITEIIDSTGDGAGQTLNSPQSVAVDTLGNVYVAGVLSNNAFRIATPGTCSTGGTPCTITEIIDSTGDGLGNGLARASDIAVSGASDVYVAGGQFSNNAFRILAPSTCSTTGTACTITEIIDNTGDGGGNTLNTASGVAVDGSGNVYVTGTVSDNVFKIASGGAISEIIDSTGDGGGNTLSSPLRVAVDSMENVFVAGQGSNNGFRITPGGAISEIIDSTGDGSGNTLGATYGVAVDSADDVYLTGSGSDNAFKIDIAVPPAAPTLSLIGIAILSILIVLSGGILIRRA